jgi:hypothetical protein
VVEALEAAGYTVRYPQYEFLLRTFAVDTKQNQNWLQRLLSKFFGADVPEVTELINNAPRKWEEIFISWEPEPVDDEYQPL